MFCPKIVSSGEQRRKRAAAARAAVTISATRWEVANVPPRLAAASRMASLTAARTASGTWLPPGVSRKMVSLLASAAKRARTAATS